MSAARPTDPSTSHQAAARRDPHELTRAQARVLALVAQFGDLSDHEIADHYDAIGTWPPISPSGLRTRRAELVEQGRLIDSGVRVKTPAGRNAVAWTLA